MTDTGQAIREGEFFEGVLDKSDRTGIIAGFVDITILAVGVIVALVWQIGLVTHPAATSTASWQSLSGSSAAASPAASSSALATPNVAHVQVCEAFVQTTFRNGQTHYVEFRGNCPAIRNMAAHSKTPVRVLPARNYTVPLTSQK